MALPNTYKKLGYIESTGTQYINTQVQVGAKDFKIVLDFQFTVMPNSNVNLFGAVKSGIYFQFGNDGSNNRFKGQVGGGNTQNYISPRDTNRHIVTLDNSTGLFQIDETSVTLTTSATSVGYNLCLFARNNAGTLEQYCSARIYGGQIYKSGVLTRNFIPVQRISDNAIGLYDDVNGTFYGSSGSGALNYAYEIDAEINPISTGTVTGTGIYTSGSSVSLEAIPNSGYGFVDWQLKGYTRLEYIENTAKSYINTGMYADNTCKFESKFKFTSTASNQQTGQFTGANILWGINGQGAFLCYANGDKTYGSADTDWHTFTIDLTNNTGSVDDNTQSLAGFSGTSGYPFYLFSRRDNSGYYTSYNCKGQLAYHKVYKSNVLVQHLIPVIRHSDSAFGLLDLVEMKFYGNNGTGTFIGGGVYAS